MGPFDPLESARGRGKANARLEIVMDLQPEFRIASIDAPCNKSTINRVLDTAKREGLVEVTGWDWSLTNEGLEAKFNGLARMLQSTVAIFDNTGLTWQDKEEIARIFLHRIDFPLMNFREMMNVEVDVNPRKAVTVLKAYNESTEIKQAGLEELLS